MSGGQIRFQLAFSLLEFVVGYSALFGPDIQEGPSTGIPDRDIGFLLGRAHPDRLVDDDALADPFHGISVSVKQAPQRPLSDEFLNAPLGTFVGLVSLKPRLRPTHGAHHVGMPGEKPLVRGNKFEFTYRCHVPVARRFRKSWIFSRAQRPRRG